MAIAGPRRVPLAPIIAVATNDADEPVAALMPLEDRCSNRCASQGPLPFHSLSHPERKDFCDRAAEVAVKRPELFYLAAAGVVAAQFNVRIDDCERKAIKNAVSRRAADAKQLAILKAYVPPSLMRS
eukprot:jgi/Tetstr1/462902/TSEL_007850.t1